MLTQKTPTGGRFRLHFGGATGIWTLSILTGATAAVLAIGGLAHVEMPARSVTIPWPALAVMFALAETFVIHLQFRRGDAHSFSLNEVCLVLGLFFTDPAGLVLAQCVGAAVALTFLRRQQPIKAVFNVAHLSLESGLAMFTFAALRSGGSSIVPADWAAALAACMIAAVTGALYVGAAVTLSQGRPSPRLIVRNFSFALISAACNTSLGLAAATILALEPRSAWLTLAPIVAVFFSYRAFSRQREKTDSLQFLYESTRVLQKSGTVQDALVALLEQTRSMFRAEIASITFFPSEGDPALRTTLGPGEEKHVLQIVDLDPREGVWARVAAEAQPILLARPIRNERLRAYFAGRGMRDAMVAPVMGDSGVVGTLVVGNRLGDVGTFEEEDLHLFETLVNHASVSLQKARLLSRLEEALARMTELNRMKDDFVSTVSHELRTPLTSIQGFVQTMLRTDVQFDPTEQREFLGVVERQTRRLGGLIEDLLVVSRIETKELRPLPFAVSLPTLVRDVIGDLSDEQHGRRLEAIVDDTVPAVMSDHEMIYRILANLIDNALKYSPQESPVQIRVAAEGSGVTISVTDQGEGIPDEVQDRIFERFYQVDQSRTRAAGGAGLGLYICRQLAGVLRGRLWIERSDASGSTFSLWIPDATGTETHDLISSPANAS